METDSITTLARINKIVRLGTSRTHGGRSFSTFARIEFDGKKLSICGVEGPLSSGNALGSCGQIRDCKIEHLAPGWTPSQLITFRAIWRRWHLNDMRAGCQHQEQKARDEKVRIPLGELCPLCNYKYGHAWNFEPVPARVLEFLESLPDTDITPAWV